MKRLALSLAAAAVVAAVVAGTFLAVGPESGTGDGRIALEPTDTTLVALGAQLYETHCAACHGANLEGEPNWRQRGPDGRLPAPPHDETGHTWHHPDEVLFELTKYGLPDEIGGEPYHSAMPAYADILTDREIIAVLSYIKSRWPAEIVERHDAINAAAR